MLPQEAIEDLAELARVHRETGSGPSHREIAESLQELYGWPYHRPTVQKHYATCVEGGWRG